MGSHGFAMMHIGLQCVCCLLLVMFQCAACLHMFKFALVCIVFRGYVWLCNALQYVHCVALHCIALLSFDIRFMVCY